MLGECLGLLVQEMSEAVEIEGTVVKPGTEVLAAGNADVLIYFWAILAPTFPKIS